MASFSTYLFLLLSTVFVFTQGQLRFDAAQQLKQKKAPPRPQVEFDLQNQPICPEFDGVYEDATYCDAYWKCANGVATEVFCDDGLVFDSRKAGHADPCDTPHVVECGSRQQLQEPTFPNEYCPRRHGSFEHPDPQVCNIYYMCVDAKFTEISCATGLYFNSTQGSCNWPHISQRTGCVDIPPSSADGFTCPPGPHLNEHEQAIPHPSFPNLEDCTKFYVCLNGITPQEASCNNGQVFDEKKMLCGLPETVPECDGWFANDPAFAHYYDDAPTSGRSDPGAIDFLG